jgi:hypothetical protein
MPVTTYNADSVITSLNQLGADKDKKILTFQMQALNNYNTLYDKVKNENERLEDSYNNTKNNHSADAQQSKYVDLSAKIIKNIYNISFWIYIVLSVVLCVFIYRNPFSLQIKLALGAVIFGFPFYIYFLENALYTFSVYIYYILISAVYSNGYSNTNIEYAGQAMHEMMGQNAKSPPLSLT